MKRKTPVRQGKYTKRLTPAEKFKRSVKRRWQWFSSLSFAQKSLVIGGPLLALLLIIPVATYAYFARDISNKERLMNRNNTGIVLMDKDGESFYSFGTAERREMVPLDDISDDIEKAVIAAEDKNFYEHGGFSILSTLRALYTNIILRDTTAFGGSTITQQLAKNTVLSDEKSYLRKYQELAVSIAIERNYTKDEILEMYLNSVHYGEGTFGILDAAETYYSKHPRELNLAESSMLIGLLPAPGAYSPISGSEELALQRQNTVLSRMVANEMITEDEKEAALSVELVYSNGGAHDNGLAPHFAEMVLSELYERYGEERVIRSGYRVTTSLDRSLQQAANDQVSGHIGYVQMGGGSNAGLVAIEPSSGAVRALVGSADWENDQFGKVNIVTSSRQPGSSFKPIYYAEALARGVITPATMVEDVPTDFNGYQPQNADRTFRGSISIRDALGRSLNIPSVKVVQELGVAKTVEAAKRMGISTLDSSADYGLSLALGSAEAKLLDMTNAYAAFGNAGRQYEPLLVESINDKFDNTIYRADASSKEVISREGAFMISNILSDDNARMPVFGNTLTVPGYQAAVKTGTTDDRRDAWTIGYTPSLAVGVWVGNNDNREMARGGSDMAGPIWRGTMQAALQGSEPVEFVRPNGVVEVLICVANGNRATRQGPGTRLEVFLDNVQPTGVCNVPDPEEVERERRREEREEERERRRRERDSNRDSEESESDNDEDDESPEGDEGTGSDSSPDSDSSPSP